MTTLPSVTGKVLVAALRKAGFDDVRVKGSHHCYFAMSAQLRLVTPQ